MQADPQSASMSKAIGADENVIPAVSHAVFAISIELDSGVRFWLVFSHGAGARREEQFPSTALVPIDQPLELQVIDEKPEEIIERCFLQGTHPASTAG